MFKWLQSRILWGTILIIGGVLLLLQNLFNIQYGGIFWSIAFFLAALFFMGIYLGNREHWWSLIPGFVLLSISGMFLIEYLVPEFEGDISGFIVLAGIALGFIAVYLADRNNWWAIIPAGVMLTLSVFVLLENLLGGFGGAGIFFLGMGMTFVVLALIPTPEGRMKWAWIPAIILIVIGLILTATTENMLAFIWPVILIILGLFMVGRTFLNR